VYVNPIWGKLKLSSSLPVSTLVFQHPSGFHLQQPIFRKPFGYIQDLKSTIRIYQHLRTISNIQYLPIPSSDHQNLPSTTRIYQYHPRVFSNTQY
jgi:hypothetical protein